MDLLIAGSIAYDTLETPSQKVDDVLGGSATYAGLAARFHLATGTIGLIGGVGQDFLSSDRELLERRFLDLSGVEFMEGRTFRWHGMYPAPDVDAVTISTEMNVILQYEPRVPAHARSPRVFLCANLHPTFQLSLIDQTESGLLIVDTMNKWIVEERSALDEVIHQTDILVINTTELSMLTGKDDIDAGAEDLMIGEKPTILVIKRGADGAVAFGPFDRIEVDGHQVDRLVDPTGCGDVFAGTMAACLISAGVEGIPSREQIQDALIHANRTASFNIESFGTERIHHLDEESYSSR